ncbi:heavy metal translocating P-type ATPase [Rarobacter faecitabidus]|uniref:P-type E1-E2 ATPase/heavy metal translocating P-type ATPase n=1 Tax=Rarobacter faecitabidus TaxID=13243 RepID=A0A542ZU86_RARFA|nr:heavy metal translocating P-type ATPase [Rarobacter faecitabidus]TQL63826.1 P-type E1-E2 ATPase/heavy metal translocating P-type ATPase [Rarobacter faecitabidus]
MARLVSAIRVYPQVFATLVVAIAGLVLSATPAGHLTAWLVGGYSLLIAAVEAVSMIRQLIKGHAGLDILAVMAITAAVLVGEPWAALIVVLMLTGGTALEDYASNRSTQELTALLRQAPQTALLVSGSDLEDGAREVPVDEVVVGDILLVRPGSVVPVDAVLLTESAMFDESSLTGESLPVDRAAGEHVSSGAVNGSTAIRMRAVATADQSEYQQIVRLVEQAAGSKSKVVRLADRYAVPFTILSLAIASIAWAVSGDSVRFAEVLVVATPCPLLIAAPVAFLGGMSRAARHGLIVNSGQTLEQLSQVRSVAFDKTGTITTGHPSLERVIPAPGFNDDEVLQYAASAEAYSSHVLAGAVVAAGRAHGRALLESTGAEELPANGVTATFAAVPGRTEVTVRVGKPSWLRQFAPTLERVEVAPGELAIYVTVDDAPAGALVMRDQTRPEASEVMRDLHELGVTRTLMVTGDVAATAHIVAREVGIDEVHADCRPADKVHVVTDVQPRPLMMVGDGLNDAPVLAAADIGLAMGARGATAASESADIVNRFDTLAGVPQAVRIGKDTVRIALQSIWLGIAISVALMLVAAAGFLPAIAGAWLQEVVDLVAILGALRAIGPRSERKPALVPGRTTMTRVVAHTK